MKNTLLNAWRDFQRINLRKLLIIFLAYLIFLLSKEKKSNKLLNNMKTISESKLRNIIIQELKMVLKEEESSNTFPGISDSDPSAIEAAASFIYRSNEIEQYIGDMEDVKSSIEGYLQGYPISYVVSDPYVRAQFAGIKAAEKGGQDQQTAQAIHLAMGKTAPESIEIGVPGHLRDNPASSYGGTKYVNPDMIGIAFSWWSKFSFSSPIERHVAYELIHPFGDGNGRSGRILLAHDLNWNWDEVNSLIGDSYVDTLRSITPKFQQIFKKEGWL